MKNQYLAMVMFIAVSIFACGSTTEDAATDEQAVVEERNSIAEAVEEEPVVVAEEVAVEEEVKVVEVLEKELDGDDIFGANIEGNLPGSILAGDAKEEIQLIVVRADHSSWSGITQKFVSPSGKVNYTLMKANISKIKTYLEHLKNTPPKKDWSKNEKLAYWINLYNASTVYLIASNYPIKSITKLNGGKPWDKKFVKSGDKVYTLNQIENEIVRPRFKDPRIHAALNCAAVSCPNLLNTAFMAKTLDAQLTKQTRVWVNDVTKNKITPTKVDMSKIFEWYAPDFKAGGGAVNFIAKYSNRKYKIDSKAKITYLEYDWALNE